MLKAVRNGALRARVLKVHWLQALVPATSMVSFAPSNSNAAKSTAYETDMVDPPEASGRLTFSADASEEQSSRPMKMPGWLIEWGKKMAMTAAPATMTPATYRRAASGSSLISDWTSSAPSRHQLGSGRPMILQRPLGLRVGLPPASRRGARLGLELIFFDLPVQRAAADIKHPRRFLFVPLHRLEHADDVRAFRFGERRHPIAGRGGDARIGMQEFDIGAANDPARGRQRRPGDRAFELADVAGPGIVHEQVERFARERLAVERHPLGGAIPREKPLSEHGNVHLPLAERRQPDGERVDAIVQVLAKA